MFGIGGGDSSGGGGGFLGGLMDPLGIFSGGPESKGSNPLQKILDPLGLFPMLQGEIDKTKGDTGDQVKTANEILSFINSNEVQQLTKSSGVQPTIGDHVPDSAKEPATTEISHRAEHDNVDGYAHQSDSASDNVMGSHDGLMSQSDASTAVQSDQVLSTEYASTAASQEALTEMNHLNTICAYFSTLDGDWKDNKFDRNNLAACLENPNDTRFPPELQEAAKYLIAHPELLNSLVNLSNAGNMTITPAGIGMYVETKKQEIQAAATNPQPEVVTGTGKTTPLGKPQGKTSGKTSGNSAPPATNGDDRYTYKAAAAPGPFGKSTSFESALDNVSKKLGTMEDRMTELTDIVINGSPEDARKANAELTNLQRQFTNLSEMRKQMYTLLSELHKSFHEMSMSAIRNMR